MNFMIYSPAFKNQNPIPIKYTCEGENISPPLKWENAPDKTKSFVLIVDDPDAPFGTWNHWILYNIPSDIMSLEENIKIFPEGAKLGKNSWRNEDYGGPCPPSGEHRYFFKLFALNKLIESDDNITRDNIEKIIKPYVLDETFLVGTYCKSL